MFNLSTPETRTLAAIIVPESGEPFARRVGRHAELASAKPSEVGAVRLAEVVLYDVQDTHSAWDLAEILGADPTAAAAELFAGIDAKTQRDYRRMATFFRSPELVKDEDVVQCWIEDALEHENAAIKLALEKVGLCYVTISPYVHPDWTDAIVRWVKSA